MIVSKKKKIIIVFSCLVFIVLFILIWAFFIEPNLLIVKKLIVKDVELDGIRVAYLCDLHICQDGKDYFSNLIKKVNEQKPDLILLGGDYVVAEIYKNKSMKSKDIALLLKELKAKYGIFMVFGNHDEYFNTYKTFSKLLKDSDIKIMQNENTKLSINGKDIYLVGIGDNASCRDRIDLAFENVKTTIIAFTHSPDIFPLLPEYVNFVFAGHTHGGQVYLPYYGPVGNPRHLLGYYIKGFYKEGNKKMYVSSGVGNSHLKVRLFNLPEIVIVDFKK